MGTRKTKPAARRRRSDDDTTGAKAVEAEAGGAAAFDLSLDGRRRVIVEGVAPEVDAGRYPIKRVVGDRVVVECDLVADGHDLLGGVLRYRRAGTEAFEEVSLEPLVNDRWRAAFDVTEIGRWQYTVEAWVDRFATFRRGLGRKAEAGLDVEVELLLGAALLRDAAARAKGKDKKSFVAVAQRLEQKDGSREARVRAALDPTLSDVVARYPDRAHASAYDRVLEIVVDRPKARFSTWYELFPRSTATRPGEHGTFDDGEARLPLRRRDGLRRALPAAHPPHRQPASARARTTPLVAEPDDVGSPWAIGARGAATRRSTPSSAPWTTSVACVEAAEEHGLEVALDIAFQCSPDHP